MKLIVRADDYGYTVAHNDGTIKAINEGIVTSVDLMLDTPGSIDAMIRIKEYPWISIGWHAHFWGRPILPPSEVPSMVNGDGKFKFRKDQNEKSTCTYDDVYRESCAQMDLCIKYLGRVPDTAWIQNTGSDFEKARKDVCDRYGISYNIAAKPNENGDLVPSKDKFSHLNIFMPNQPATIYKVCYDESVAVRKTYDPVKYYLNDEGKILDKQIALTAWHPGFLDDYVIKESRLTEPRVVDVIALCSESLKQWIVQNKIELINHRDALNGTSEYQNYLASQGSEMYVK